MNFSHEDPGSILRTHSKGRKHRGLAPQKTGHDKGPSLNRHFNPFTGNKPFMSLTK